MQKQRQKHKLLLIQDVDGLGRSGDLVSAKPGFIRNYLFPKKMAVAANQHTLRMQDKLQEERRNQAVSDKADAEALAQKIDGKTFEIEVKVDPDGHMYGSVSTLDLVHLFEQEGLHVERKNFLLGQTIKQIGTHTIKIKLKEDVPASFTLQINSDIEILKPAVVEPIEQPAVPEKAEEAKEKVEAVKEEVPSKKGKKK